MYTDDRHICVTWYTDDRHICVTWYTDDRHIYVTCIQMTDTYVYNMFTDYRHIC